MYEPGSSCTFECGRGDDHQPIVSSSEQLNVNPVHQRDDENMIDLDAMCERLRNSDLAKRRVNALCHEYP